jgi:hypothetical protein
VEYFPCLFALSIIAFCARGKPAAKYLAYGAMIFTASLTFRSVDMAVCDSFALGTHFMWHICNGALLYTLVKALLINDCKRQQSV